VRINGAMPYDLSGLVEGNFSTIELL